MRRFYAVLICAVLISAAMVSCEESVELDYLTGGEVAGWPYGSDEPDEPENPDDPNNPDNPDDPNDPNNPDEPENPDDPNNPDVPDIPGGDDSSRVLLMYFVGTSLDSDFGRNIAAAKSVMSPDVTGNGSIVYFRRQSGSEWAIRRIALNEAGVAEDIVLKTYPDADLTDMRFFLSEMIRFAPAESYGLVFGGHGTGWLPKNVGLTMSSTYSVGGGGSYIAPFGELPREDALPTRFFGESKVIFDVGEIAENMISTGAKFDFLIFDDCFMSNIEALYAMRHAVDYIIASPCEVMAAGFPYDCILPYIFADGGCDLAGVCRAFYEYYMYDYSIHSGCVALTVCSELDALAEAYRNLAAGAVKPVDVSKLQYYEGLAKHLFYDFGQYAGLLSANPMLLNDFREQFDRAFPPKCRLNTPSFYSAFGSRYLIDIDYYSGVTISEPADRNEQDNRQTEWYRATHMW